MKEWIESLGIAIGILVVAVIVVAALAGVWIGLVALSEMFGGIVFAIASLMVMVVSTVSLLTIVWATMGARYPLVGLPCAIASHVILVVCLLVLIALTDGPPPRDAYVIFITMASVYLILVLAVMFGARWLGYRLRSIRREQAGVMGE